MRTAAAKGKSSWRLIAGALAALLVVGAAEASRFSPRTANGLLEKQGTSSLAAVQRAGELAATFALDPASRFPLLTGVDRHALAARLAPPLVWPEKLASGVQTWEPRLNLWRINELASIPQQRAVAYARNRWYDPRNASWLSEDPAGDIDSPNLYAFVAWQPSMATDPMGLADDWKYDPSAIAWRENHRPPVTPEQRARADAASGTILIGGGCIALTALYAPAGVAVCGGAAVDSTIRGWARRHEQATDVNPYASAFESFGVAVGDTFGLTPAVELNQRVEVYTGAQLTGLQRAERQGTLIGVGVTIGIGGLVGSLRGQATPATQGLLETPFDRPAGGTGRLYNRETGQGLYILLDELRRPRYIGRGDAPARVARHALDEEKGQFSARILFENNLTKAEAKGLEQALMDAFGGPTRGANGGLLNRIRSFRALHLTGVS